MSRHGVHIPLLSAEECAVLLGRDPESVSGRSRTGTERGGAEAARQRMTVNLPVWMAERLDREAERRGVATEALIRSWLARQIRQQAAESEN